jgi:hypothetical protein
MWDAPEINFRKKTFRIGALLLTLLLCPISCLFAAPRIIEHEQRNSRVDNLEDITFFLRFPDSLKEGEPPQGVLADINYLTDPKTLKKWVSRPASQRPLFQFAEKHKLVVVTWTTAWMYNVNRSFDKDKRELLSSENDLQRSLKSWNRGMNVLCKTYGLPESDYLIYGMSRGAQWAHRFALRKPEKFLAVHAHVNSSYEEPQQQAKSCLWLITTGDREYGYPSGIEFYRKCQAMGFPMIFKSEGNLGHKESPQITELGIRFFEYALELKNRREKIRLVEDADRMGPKTIPQTGFPDYLVKDFFEPPYVGDLLNGDVFPVARKTEISEKLQVPIPTEAIAKAWGFYQK